MVINMENKIKIIYDSLDQINLDNDTLSLLNQFMEAYHQTLDEYVNLQVPNNEIANRLKLLTGPINKAMTTPDGPIKYPAVDFIKEKINNHGVEMEKGFTKKLVNPNAPSTIPEEEPTNYMNGFSFSIILVCFTILIGMILGALAFVLNK